MLLTRSSSGVGATVGCCQQRIKAPETVTLIRAGMRLLLLHDGLEVGDGVFLVFHLHVERLQTVLELLPCRRGV